MKSLGPLLAIRADAGHRMGIGHVMRTLAVAQCWQSRGGRVAYLSASLPESLETLLRERDIAVHQIDGVRDAEHTVEMMTRLNGVALLVDHYALPEGWWASIPSERRWRTAAINDFVMPIHREADILISPRVNPLPGEIASGSDYLLVRSELVRASPVRVSVTAQRVLIVLGGADPLGLAPIVAEWLLSRFPDIAVRVVDGPAAKNGECLARLAQTYARLETVVAPRSMRSHYEWADTAICSPSTSVFEALHHGVVTGLVLTADNQTEVAGELVEAEAALLIADARGGDFIPDRKMWEKLSSDRGARIALGERGAGLVDGNGAGRACSLLGLPAVQFRDATLNDAQLLLDWANDPTTRKASFSDAVISWEQHHAWMNGRLKRSDPFWLAEDEEGRSLAVVRFDATGGDATTISFNLAPDRRGGGLSSLILGKACQRFRESHPAALIYAWIKTENTASLRCFMKAGFVETLSEKPDRKLYILSP